MCNWMNKANSQFQNYGHACVEDSFPQFANQLPPSSVRPGHCWCCGKPLSQQEMFPPGHPPRYMCDGCYQNLAYSWPNNKCLTCGGELPGNQVQQRIGNPRELSYALHKGPCDDYHSVMAGIVLGLPFQTRNVPTAVPGMLNNLRINNPALLNPPQTLQPLGFQPIGTAPLPLASEPIHNRLLKPVRKVKHLGFPK